MGKRNSSYAGLPCAFQPCDNTSWAKGLCGTHYSQQRKGKELTPVPDRRKWTLTRADQEVSESGEKYCRDCKRFRPPSNFIRNRKLCNQCCELRHKYKLSYSELMAWILLQGGCAGCGKLEETDGSILSVDHDHTCCPGLVTCGLCMRGVLCRDCNTSLGRLKDNVQTLRNLIEYLEDYRFSSSIPVLTNR